MFHSPATHWRRSCHERFALKQNVEKIQHQLLANLAKAKLHSDICKRSVTVPQEIHKYFISF
jgi:hypothetical protein